MTAMQLRTHKTKQYSRFQKRKNIHHDPKPTCMQQKENLIIRQTNMHKITKQKTLTSENKKSITPQKKNIRYQATMKEEKTTKYLWGDRGL